MFTLCLILLYLLLFIYYLFFTLGSKDPEGLKLKWRDGFFVSLPVIIIIIIIIVVVVVVVVVII